MTDSVLLLDAGNTRLKWAVSRGDVLHDHGVHAYSDSDSYGIPDALASVTTLPARALFGSVASARINLQVDQWLTGHNVDVAHARVQELEQLKPAYADLTTLGVDRWLAMLGARSLYPGAVCVADCGTALTLDSVDPDGNHLGGMIVPGFALMQRALLTQTARIHDADQPLPSSLFADSTGAAVTAGATYSLAATLDRFVIETEQALGCDPVVIVTGGGRERLMRYAQCDVIEVPDLVLLGLAVLADGTATPGQTSDDSGAG